MPRIAAYMRVGSRGQDTSYQLLERQKALLIAVGATEILTKTFEEIQLGSKDKRPAPRGFGRSVKS